MSAHTKQLPTMHEDTQNSAILTILQDIRTEQQNTANRLNALETRETGSLEGEAVHTAQEIIHQTAHPQSGLELLQNMFIYGGIFFLIGLAIIPVVWSRWRKSDKKMDKIDKSLNGYGNRKDGTPILLRDVQLEQLRIQRDNNNILRALAKAAGFKVRPRDSDLLV